MTHDLFKNFSEILDASVIRVEVCDLKDNTFYARIHIVEEISVSDNVVVIHTPPGAAHLVAGAIDAARVDGAIGTIAGDDTLMVVADAEVGGSEVASKIEEMGVRR